MSLRLMLVEPAKKLRGIQVIAEVWEVLTPDLREQEFQGSYEDCLKYLRTQCPTGSCEE